MSFLFQLGLWGLIGIPIIIIIYIIKSKYREYTVSSTFIWEMSEKFLKKKSPLSKISGLLSLILQLLIVFVLSFALAHPIISIPDSAKNYLFVVDNSASMNIADRFENAKNEMYKIVDEAKNDSTFSIIVAGNEVIPVCKKQTDKERVKSYIENLHTSTLSSSVSNGMLLAQEYFDEDNSLNVYLFTDINYTYGTNVEIINVCDDTYNASINSLFFTKTDEEIRFIGEIVSYGVETYEVDEDGKKIEQINDVDLDLYLDGTLYETVTVPCVINEDTQFVISIDSVDFIEAKVVITNDEFDLDNEYVLYGNESVDNYRVLLVSDQPFYIKNALNAMGGLTVDTIKSTTFSDKYSSGYDLYVFDGYAPSILPSDGATWLFNVKTNSSNSGFTSQGTNQPANGASFTLSRRSGDIYDTLTQHMFGNTISVSTFVQYSIISNSFEVVMSYNSYPMVFAGINTEGNREVVFSFDLHDSNFPLLIDYTILLRNMVKYCLPQICDESDFGCGDELVVNVLPNCDEIRVNTPSNRATYLSTDDAFATMILSELGTYTIEAKINNIIKTYKIYVTFPQGEQNPNVIFADGDEGSGVQILGEKNNVSFVSTYDIQWILFIVLLALCILEWVVYLYEQRQTR